MEAYEIQRQIEAWREAVWEREWALTIARQELAKWTDTEASHVDE